MSTVHSVNMECGLCGKVSRQRVCTSTICLGGCDLDFRPAPLARHMLFSDVHVCPECGFASYMLKLDCSAEEREKVRALVNGNRYRFSGSTVNSPVAARFIRQAMVCRTLGDLSGEMTAYLRAAWACDDAGDRCSRMIRRECENRTARLMQTEPDAELALIDADLLRRTFRYDEVIEKYSDFDERFPDAGERLSAMMAEELRRSRDHDPSCVRYCDGSFETVEEVRAVYPERGVGIKPPKLDTILRRRRILGRLEPDDPPHRRGIPHPTVRGQESGQITVRRRRPMRTPEEHDKGEEE